MSNKRNKNVKAHRRAFHNETLNRRATQTPNIRHLSANEKVTSSNALQVLNQLVPKSATTLQVDVKKWRQAQNQYRNVDSPRAFPIHNIYDEIDLDGRLTSQIQNRKLKTTGSEFVIKKANKEQHDEATELCQKSQFFNKIIGQILDTITHGSSLIELDREEDTFTSTLVPRQNVLPVPGTILKDYTDDDGIQYREETEFGTWLLELGEAGDIGLLNKAVPHVIFKRFAQSCWSECCEIVGIPPRVMKTNTVDPSAMRRAEQMMRDMGSAAWFIIDDTEEFEFADGIKTDGSVYQNLINLCNNEICLLFSGAIIGQDTKFGSNAKEQSSQNVLADLIKADKKLVEQTMQDVIMPALYRIGFLPEDGLIFEYAQIVNTSELWTRTKEILPYKTIDNDWIKDKFGIEVTGDVQKAKTLSADPDFFV